MQDSSLEIIPTKAMLLKKNIAVKAVNEYKAVIFETHKSKKSKGAQGNLHKKASMAEKRNEAPALDMKRVRHEVLNFGISGHDFQNQQKANMALAIRLGAKPQKNIYKNYKELQVYFSEFENENVLKMKKKKNFYYRLKIKQRKQKPKRIILYGPLEKIQSDRRPFLATNSSIASLRNRKGITVLVNLRHIMALLIQKYRKKTGNKDLSIHIF